MQGKYFPHSTHHRAPSGLDEITEVTCIDEPQQFPRFLGNLSFNPSYFPLPVKVTWWLLDRQMHVDD
jgi:hypothetical protein